MKNSIVIGINLGDFGSTGNIMRNSLEYASKNGDFDYLIIVPKSNGKANTYSFFEQNNFFDKLDRRLFHRSLGNPDGLYEFRATKRITKKIDEQCKFYKNVIVHLHNLHMAYIDFRVLFKYLAKNTKITRVFYTIHDEWPYSGACYYVNTNSEKFLCNEWKTGCRCECPQKYGTKRFPVFKIWELKRKYSLLLKEKMVLLPVSNWIDSELSNSFFKGFKRVVINGETNISNLGYRDTELIKKMSLDNKKIILTISAYWNEWKGTEYIYKIAEKLPNDYVIVVVGGRFDVKDYTNIIHINDVPNEQLNHFYSIADVYLSTSQAESLGLTTCEAQICGVPVVAFGHTAIKETFIDGVTGIMIGEDNNVNRMVQGIIEIVEKTPFNKQKIIENGMRFGKNTCSKRYFDLYKNSIIK